MMRGVLIALLLALSLPAWAHGLRLSAAASATGFAGRAYYSDDTPAAGERVRALTADGQSVADTLTGADGRFTLPIAVAGRYTLVASGEEGHRSEAILDFAPPAEQTCATVMRTELQQLREDFARSESRIRMHEVIGGVGYLVGLAGLMMMWRARR